MNFGHINMLFRPMATLIVSTLLFLCLLGIFFAMQMSMDGGMDKCPFDTGSSICVMDPFSHVGIWQSIFNSEVKKSGLIILLSVLLIVNLDIFLKYAVSDFYLINKRHPKSYIPFHNILQPAFSRGIINPKLH